MFSGNVQKYGAAASGDWRIVIVSELDHHVIKVVLAPHFFVGSGKWQIDQTVIRAVCRIIAPAKFLI